MQVLKVSSIVGMILDMHCCNSVVMSSLLADADGWIMIVVAVGSERLFAVLLRFGLDAILLNMNNTITK